MIKYARYTNQLGEELYNVRVVSSFEFERDVYVVVKDPRSQKLRVLRVTEMHYSRRHWSTKDIQADCEIVDA